jgi:thymidylate synthase
MIFDVQTNVSDVRRALTNQFTYPNFVVDKTGCKMVEILGAQFIADESEIFGRVSQDYIFREFDWYETQSLNVNDMKGNVPDVWLKTADSDGNVNSNYGWCVYSAANGYQYQHCLSVLRQNPDTRRAMMIYTRPSMQDDYRNDKGLNDFICCNYAHYFIRFNTLFVVVSFRSNDVVFGYKNDYAWHSLIYNRLYKDLLDTYPNLRKSDMIWQADSLHVYERHFYLLEYYDAFGIHNPTKEEYEKTLLHTQK